MNRTASQRRRSRKPRRVVRALVRTFIWLLVIGAAFVMGVGIGQVVGDAGGTDRAAQTITIEDDRGTFSATIPTTTVTETETETVTITERQAERLRRQQEAAEN